MKKCSGISQIQRGMNDSAINLGRFAPILFMTASKFNSFTPSNWICCWFHLQLFLLTTFRITPFKIFVATIYQLKYLLPLNGGNDNIFRVWDKQSLHSIFHYSSVFNVTMLAIIFLIEIYFWVLKTVKS